MVIKIRIKRKDNIFNYKFIKTKISIISSVRNILGRILNIINNFDKSNHKRKKHKSVWRCGTCPES